VKVAVSRTKSQLLEVAALIGEQNDRLAGLASEIEVSGSEARAAMSDLDVRLLRIHARKHGGAAARARMLTGDSGALTLRIEVERLDGTPACRRLCRSLLIVPPAVPP